MKRLKRFGKQMMIAMLLVSLNINPIATVAGAVYESGVVDRFSNFGKRLYLLSTGHDLEVHAADDGGADSYVVNVSCDCDHQEIPISGGQVQVHDRDVATNTRYSMERLGHISNKMTDLIDEVVTTRLSMIDGFNRIEDQLIQVNEKLDVILRSLHHYRVAHVYSLNNSLGNALYRPHTEDVPYVDEFVTVTGQFANVYMGHWDANVPDVVNPYPAERALEVLGYDALVRAEGVEIISDEQLAEKDATKLHSPGTVNGESTLSSSNLLQHVPTEEELKVYNELPEEMKEIYGIHPENNSVIPKGDIVRLTQEFIPEENITWLDAATLLYKALDEEIYTYQSFFTRNREITPENSPLSQSLSGVKEFDGFDYYVFTTRNNLIEGDGHNHSTTYLYWMKAINDGFVSYDKRDTPIQAWEFYGLAADMMQAYGEPVMNDDEIKALLQVYGDEYPVQLGTEIADDWAYLKARGILAKDLDLDISDNLSRHQLLDICMRIKDDTAREDYKSIQISLDIGQLMRDNGYYPVYDLDWGVDEFDITSIIDYAAMSNYTYLLAAPESLQLNTLGYGDIYSEPEFNDEKLVAGAQYCGRFKMDGKYYYRVEVPKSYNGNFYLGFTYVLDDSQRNGENDFIEVTSSNLGGGIYTAYTILDNIATVDKKKEGVNYFKFNHRSQDKSLRQFADIDRCNIEEKEVARMSYGVSVNADPFSKVLAFVDEMTTPIVAHAVGGDKKSNTTHITLPLWADEVTGYSAGAKKVTYSSGKDMFNKTASAAGQSICTDGSEVYIPTQSFATSLSRMNTMNVATSRFTETPGNTLQSQLVASLNSDAMPGFWTNFAFGVGSQKKFDEMNSGLDASASSSYGGVESLRKSPQYTNATKLTVTGPTVDGDKIKYEIIADDNNKLVTGLDALYGSKESTAAETLEGVEDAWAELNYDVTTDTIMSRDENLLISWSALKDAGLAWSLSKTTDDYTYDSKNGTYSFMTGCGSVLINETYQYMQVGTTLYTFQNGDKPANLVYVDPNLSEQGYQEVYFDVRCVLGIASRRFEALSDTKVVEQTKMVSAAIGDDASYSINPDQLVGLSDDNIFNQKTMALSNFPEYPGTTSYKSNLKTYNSNLITSTIYDNMEIGPSDGDKYWPEGTKASRISMSHFNPTANYMLCVSDMSEQSTVGNNGIQASVYVYYLKEAYTSGFDNTGDGKANTKVDGNAWKDEFKKQFQEALTSLSQSQYANNKATLDQVAKEYGGYQTINAMAESSNWYDIMTAASLTEMFAFTGRVYIEKDYVVRKFDVSSNFLAGSAKSQKLTTAPNDNVTTSNNSGYCYWIPNIGFVYNIPKVSEFTLEKYYSGEYMLPIAIGSSGVITYNLNYYSSFTTDKGKSVDVPIGWELTDTGYVHYKDSTTTTLGNPVPKGGTDNSTPPFDVKSFIPAPAGVYSRYGIWRQDDIHSISAENLTSAYTDSEAVYYGSRRVFSEDATLSDKDGSKSYAFNFGCNSYNSIGIPGSTKAYICMQSQGRGGKLFASYVMPRTSMIEGVGDVLTDVREIPLYSEDEVSWAGKVKLESFLNCIDKGTNMILFFVFTVAPMICVIAMTVLIGLSFMTQNKLYLWFVSKGFDPVRILTLGARGSDTWHWNTVLIPCIITYITCALFANANILKIIIWIVDAWVRLTAFIKF